MPDFRRSLGPNLVHLQWSKLGTRCNGDKKYRCKLSIYEITNPPFKLLCLVQWRIYYQMMVSLVLLTSADDNGVCVDNSICETSSAVLSHTVNPLL